jgi:membrane protein
VAGSGQTIGRRTAREGPKSSGVRGGAPERRRVTKTLGLLPGRGWRETLGRVRSAIREDHLDLVAAGIAFYLFLALFPALFAAISIYGLVADPARVEEQLGQLAGVLPEAALELVGAQLGDIVSTSPVALGWGAALAILVALLSAGKGAKAMIGGLNVAYQEAERRGTLRLQGLALVFTLGFLLFLVASVALIAVVPHLLGRLPLAAAGRALAPLGQWLLLVVLILTSLALVYRYGPSRSQARWSWVEAGSMAAALLWVLASALFSWYAASFGNFNETYGTLAGVVVLLLWLQVSSFVILLGAALNAELEHQSARDTTVRGPQPMGRRGGVRADALAEPPTERG